MDDLLTSLFRSDYMPHGHCYWWKPDILWLNVLSDSFIALAYFSIPFVLYNFVKRRPDLQFKGIFILFSLFIAMCGITHLISIIVIWHGWYGVHGLAKMLTAIVSCITAYQLYKAIPSALALPSISMLKQAYEDANNEKLERTKLEALHQQDAILRESTDSAHVGILVISDQGNIMVANRAVCQIFEYGHEELEGQHINILVQSGFAGKHSHLVSDFIKHSKADIDMAADRIVHGVTKSGREVPIEVRLNHRVYQGKRVVFVSLQDISRRLQAERARDQSETVTRNIMQSLPMGLHIFELKNNELIFTHANHEARQLLKQHHPVADKDTIKTAFPCVQSSQHEAAYFAIATSDSRVLNKEIQLKTDDIEGDFIINAFQSSPGKVIVLFQDISEKKRTDKALREQDELVRRAINASIAGVFVYDVRLQKTRYINERYESITGYNLEAVNQHALVDIIHPEDQENVFQHIRQLLSSRNLTDAFSIQYRLRHANGDWIWVIAQGTAFEHDNEGRVTQFMGSFLDITPMKKLQQNLLMLKENAESANLAKSQFLANMSHEIRTPMNAIIALTDITLDMELGNKQREYLEKVYEASRSLLRILNDILDYSKLEANKVDIVEAPFDLYMMLSNALRLFAVTASQKGLELNVDVAPNVPRYLIGDAARLTQILNNLVGNALKFTDEGSVLVMVNADINHDANTYNLRIDVSDTGIGIDEHNQALLFEAFTQADNTILRRFGGSGLGLAICRRLSEMMQGTLTFESRSGLGSTFTLQLPVLVDTHHPGAQQSAGAPLAILMVGDDSQSSDYLQRYLKTNQHSVGVLPSLPHFATETLTTCDVMIIDLTTQHDALRHTTLTTLVGLPLTSLVRKGVIIISNEVQHRQKESHLTLPCPLTWLVTPFTPAEVEEALLQLNQPHQQRNNRAEFKHIDSSDPIDILLVEDNATNQYVATELLRKIGVNVIIATDGEQAVSLFQSHSPHAVLMDLHMPVMDGFEATRQIRQSRNGVKVPIFAMSAAVSEKDAETIKAVGMNGFIQKPIDKNTLFGTLGKVLPRLKQHFPGTESPLQGNENRDRQLALMKNALPELDIELATGRLGNDLPAYTNLLSRFLTEYGPTEAAQAFPHNRPPVDRALHTLKGLAGSIGAGELASLVKQIEPVCDDPSTDYSGLQEMLVLHLRHISDFIASVEPTKVSGPPQGVASLPQLREILKARAYLREADVESFRALLEHEYDDATIGQIIDAIVQLRYDDALLLMDNASNNH